MFEVALRIDFFSPLPFTSLDVFLNNWCILNVPAAPAGRWHCHMVSSSTCEPRVCFSQDVLDHSRCKVPALGSVQGWSCAIVASDRTAPQLPCTVVPYWGLCYSLRVAPDMLVCQWCPSSLTAASGSILGELQRWNITGVLCSVVLNQHCHSVVRGACLCDIQSCVVWAPDSSFSHAQQDTDLEEEWSKTFSFWRLNLLVGGCSASTGVVGWWPVSVLGNKMFSVTSNDCHLFPISC